MNNLYKILPVLLIIGVYFIFTAKKTSKEQPGEGNVAWIEDMETAIKKSRESGKPILINFTGSDWCHFCIMLEKEVFSKKAFEDWVSTEVIPVICDFPQNKKQSEEQKKKNAFLAEKYQIRGFPTILVVDSKGKELARSGYQEGGAANWVKDIKAQIID